MKVIQEKKHLKSKRFHIIVITVANVYIGLGKKNLPRKECNG